MRPKILFLDIETSPAVGYFWNMFDDNMTLDRLIKPCEILCWSAKWGGQSGVMFGSGWTDSKHNMLLLLHQLVSEADAVVTYNGDKFDIPWLLGEFARAGLSPLPALTSIDLYKAVKKFRVLSNKLEFIGPYFGVGHKIKTDFSLWKGVMAGNALAQNRMERYNRRDTVLLERLYKRLRPYIKNHPHLGKTASTVCGACGGVKLQARGHRRTKAYEIQRLWCKKCGAWRDGTRRKL